MPPATNAHYDALTTPLQKAVTFLQRLRPKNPQPIRELVFYANLVEAVKTMTVIRHLMLPVDDPRLLTSEPAECLTRLLYERNLLVRQLTLFEGEEAFLRYVKTADESMAQKWADWQRKHSEVSAKQLPNYAQMAANVDKSGDAGRLYSQLSHLAHPKTSIPYGVAESTTCKQQGITQHEFFALRCSQIVPIAERALNEIVAVAEHELRDSLKHK